MQVISELGEQNQDAVVLPEQLLFEDVARLWAHFENWDSQQLAGFAIEPPSSRWYHRLADRNHPNGDKNGAFTTALQLSLPLRW